jgi:hypothetical protein
MHVNPAGWELHRHVAQGYPFELLFSNGALTLAISSMWQYLKQHQRPSRLDLLMLNSIQNNLNEAVCIQPRKAHAVMQCALVYFGTQ